MNFCSYFADFVLGEFGDEEVSCAAAEVVGT